MIELRAGARYRILLRTGSHEVLAKVGVAELKFSGLASQDASVVGGGFKAVSFAFSLQLLCRQSAPKLEQ